MTVLDSGGRGADVEPIPDEPLRDAYADRMAARLLVAPVPAGMSPATRAALILELHRAGILDGPRSRWFRFRLWLARLALRALRIDPDEV